ncbi:hypothetical protein DM01DRAFT_1332838 [Hesseltinella vesiculosa]|uniref:Uncharacterized protein n=1 Tax=Hesseltinella vesiculosa TaxID=101127 RepID=A0A1X2GT85_9FUNG|nr:hypothetical protein DM01DRAFT_1332838 [Hesseltinella vesiculosa]
MGLAPDPDPYIRQQKALKSGQERTHMADHSLSPEKLGVVGYVKDVAGFVRDTIHDIRDQRQQKHQDKAIQDRRTSVDNEKSTSPPPQDITHAQGKDIPAKVSKTASTPLADMVTGMFPGISQSSPPGCTHADALRHDLSDQMNKLHGSKESRLM